MTVSYGTQQCNNEIHASFVTAKSISGMSLLNVTYPKFCYG